VAKRPPSLIYGLDERPPATTLGLLAVQHVLLMSSPLVLPVALISGLGFGFNTVSAVVSLTMIACGTGTILQALRLPFLGSGYLCPNLCGPNFFYSSVTAAWLGGLPLMRGMTVVAGLVEIVFARFMPRLAFLFPPEITGLVVLMVGLGLIPMGLSKFMGISYAGEPIDPLSFSLACATLLLMVGLNVWGSARVRLYGVLIGMAAGYALSWLFGLMQPSDFANVREAPWIGLPHYAGMLDFAFEWSLLPTFVIVSLCGALKSIGNLTLAEKVNDDDWKGPDTERIGRGLVADGVAVTLSGLIGGMASDTSASNVALSGATGATSRAIAFAAGGLYVVLGFSPKIGAVLTAMPAPVGGAIVVFVTCFMLASGLQMVVAAKLDTRRTFALGIAMCFGFSLDIAPALWAHVPGWVRPLLDSSLTLAVVVAVALTQLFRLGAGRTEPPPPAD
jgi:xanthine permease XanP